MIDRSIANKVKQRKLSYLSPEKFAGLYDCLDEIDSSQVAGDFLEFGVALGGSGICLARALTGDRRYFGFDAFGIIPPPSSKDGKEVATRYKVIRSGKSQGIGGDRYYGYVDNLYDVVKNNFHSFGLEVDGKRIALAKGLFQDTLPKYEELRIALAHLDCDWYESVLLCLNYTWPRLSEHGLIVIDDYNDWSGCKKATDEFTSSQKDLELVRYRPHAVLRKVSLAPRQTQAQ